MLGRRPGQQSAAQSAERSHSSAQPATPTSAACRAPAAGLGSMRRAALWLWLCALALRLQPVLPQIVAVNVPPEDQDGSGDDSDNFSGSGAGALPDVTLPRQTSSTLKDVWLLTATPTAPEHTSRNAEAAFTSILPTAEKPEGGEPVLAAVDTGLTARDKEMEVTTRPRETTQLPITQRVSTVRATTAQAVTSHPHRDVQPGLHETLVPTAPGQPDHQPPSATEGGTSVIKEVVEDGATNQLPAGEGSGEQDFTFETSGENTAVAAIEPDQRNQQPVDDGATGASQGLLDRKEVLGGVIAGGLVGLIFAVCLVAFMLYRMKKKDEGSYSLEEPKQANGGAYQKPTKQEEFYA